MDLSKIPLYTPQEENKIAERIYKTSVDGLYYIESKISKDERGFFREVAILSDLQSILPFEFSIRQINHANSQKNVARGIHAEDWNKLVTIASGEALCVLSDINPNSPTFLSKEYSHLGYENNALSGAIFITKGIGNSVLMISDSVEYLYFVDKLYRDRDTTGDRAISLFDPTLQVEWPIPKEEMIISKRDSETITLKELFPDKIS